MTQELIKMIAAAGRRPGMTHSEYVAYVRDVHGAIARAEPVTLKRYVQNHIFDGAFGSRAEATHQLSTNRDSVTELYWESFTAMGQTFAHPYTREKVGPDGANFADTRTSLSLIATEEEIPVPNAGMGAVKVMHFLRAREGLGLAEFFARWRTAHTSIMAAQTTLACAVRRCVHNRQFPEGNAMLKYFGAENNVPYEGIVSLWFDDEATLGKFREYERALLDINATDEGAFYLAAQSFFVYVRELDIL